MKLQTYKTDKGWVAVSDERSEVGNYFKANHNDLIGKITDIKQGTKERIIHYGGNLFTIETLGNKIIATSGFHIDGIPEFELEEKISSFKEYSLKAAIVAGIEVFLLGEWVKDNNLNVKLLYDSIFRFIDVEAAQPKKLIAIDVGEESFYPNECNCFKEEITDGCNNPMHCIIKDRIVITKSPNHPDGLLTVKEYIYE